MHPDRWSLGVLPRGVGRGSLRACGLAGGHEQRTGRVFGECGPSSHLEIWRGLSGRSGILAKTLGEGTARAETREGERGVEGDGSSRKPRGSAGPSEACSSGPGVCL